MKASIEKGFTLVELLVVSPIVLVIAVAIMTFLFNEFGASVKQDGQLNLQLEAQNILFGLQDDLWYASQFTSGINPSFVDNFQPSGGWTTSASPAPLIVSTTALTTNRRDPNRQPVYINESSCTPADGDGVNSVLYNDVIYFVSGANLYKRTVSAPSTMPTCGSSFQKQSCPESNSGPDCPPDRLLSDHVESFNITYYDTNNSTVTTPETAQSVKVDISLKGKAYGDDIHATSSLRLRKLNQ